MPTNVHLNIKRHVLSFLITGIVFGTGMMKGEDSSNLPKTEILGKEYYIYEVKRGESIYGIAKKYGWELEEVMRLNPDATSSLVKGEILYYPTGKVTVVTDIPTPIEIDYSTFEPIRHKVKKGETIYSISRQYNVPLEIIYKHNPASKKGVKTGDEIIIPQNGSAGYYYYTIKKNDTLSSLSKQYNTSIEDILKSNAGLTINNFHAGETIRIPINSNIGKVKTELVTEDIVSRIDSYKVGKNESWNDISEKTGVEVEVLKDANKGNMSPQNNTVINVPVLETVEVEKTVSYESQPDLSEWEVQELYDSIKGVNKDIRLFDGVKMALILDEPSSKKDIDFTRGVLVALAGMEKSPYKIDLKVIDGRVSSQNLTDELENFEPNFIVSTADRTFPAFLADYGNTNNVQILNVFDLKNDLYEDNASLIQLLPPSSLFNDRLANQIFQDNKKRKLLGVGQPEENDGLGNDLFSLFQGNGESISLEEFGSLEPDLMESYLFYSHATKKEEIADFLTNVDNLVENNPGLDFRIIGRSNWLMMVDDFKDKFEDYGVMVPSRVWLDENSDSYKTFSDKYEEMFEGAPVRSIPNFAVCGYDVAEYFIPIVASNQGDFNKDLRLSGEETIQSDFNLKRVNNWGGFVNIIGYIVRFNQNGKEDKIIVM